MLRSSLTLSAVVLAAAATLLATGPAAAAKGKKGQKRPNIVLIVTDDQTVEMLNSETMPKTRKLIEGKGTSFTNAIATTPLCCPSRASIITGQYGHNNGVLDNKYRLLKQKKNVLPAWLRKSGYRTMHVGRYMNGYERTAKARTRVAPGWDKWHSLIKPRRYYNYTLSVNGGTVPYGDAPEDYLTTVLNDRAVSMIDRFAPRKQPFFLQFDHFAPHVSGGDAMEKCTSAAVPGPADETAFDDTPLPKPPSYNEQDMSDKPSFMQDTPRFDKDTVEKIERRYRCALGSLREVDRSVAAIDKALRRTGDRNNTVVIFFSDNGFYYGEHRLATSKNYPYEEAVAVPLLIRSPKRWLGGKDQPSRVSEPVANIDLAPTILSFARAKPCKNQRKEGRCRTMDGRSLRPLLRGRSGKFPSNRGLVVELQRKSGVAAEGDGSGTCAYYGLRVPGHIYIQHTAARDPELGECTEIDERELYDLGADPYQLDSTATQPGSLTSPTSLQLGLAARLEKLHDCAGIRGRDDKRRGRAFCE